MSDPDDSLFPVAGFSSAPDSELLRKFAGEADQQAFAELVRRHSGWVISTAQRRCGLPDLAQECAQNVFLALARKAPRLKSIPSVAPWLHRAAVLEIAALLRRESRYRQAMKRHQDESPIHHHPTIPHDAWQAMRDRVDEALNGLSGADREVLILHHVEGRTFPEIAQSLGATEAAAQRRGHRALEKLSARLRRAGVGLPVAAMATAWAAGMKAEAAQAPPLAASVQHILTTGSSATIAAAGHRFSFPAWGASPAMLAAVVLVSAGLPVWWGNATQARTFPPAGSAHPVAGTIKDPAAPVPAAPSSGTDFKLSFLRQALEELRRQPSSGEPTRLGLQLRKYMLTLTAEDLEPVGKLLGEVPGYEGEFPAILGAFSTRLAQADPPLALGLLGSAKDKGDGRDGGIRFSRTAIMDVLSRGPHLAEVLRICGKDKDLNMKLISVWAAHDGPAAAAHAEELLTEFPEQFDRSTYLMPWLLHHPVDAVKWLDAHAEANPEIFARVNSLLFLELGGWAVQQLPPRNAVELTLGLQDPVVRNGFVSGMFKAYSRKQPEVLAGLAPLLQVEDHGKPLSVAHVLTAWRRKDETAAAAWVETMPDGALKSAAQRSLARPLPDKP